MHHIIFRRLGLCDEAGDNSTPTSGGAAAPATPPAEGAAPAPATITAKPGPVDRALAMFKDKGALVSEITTLRQENESLKASNGDLTAKLADITAKHTALQAEINRLETAVNQAMAEKTTVQKEVTHHLATMGVPENQLPASAKTAAPGETLDEVRQQLSSTSDPAKRGELAAKARKLREQAAKQNSPQN